MMVTGIQDMMLIKIQRRIGALVHSSTDQVMVMKLVMVMLNALKMMMMA